MLIMHISISDNISIIHKSNSTIKREKNPNNHVYGNSPVTIYMKGAIPKGINPKGKDPNDSLTSTVRS